MIWASAKPQSLPERYVDLGSIGQGSMGEVRRVRDTVLDCDVAIKLLSHELSERSASRVRFRTEAEITARLQHPSIVEIHDYGKLEDGRPWFTMQYVDGRTLRVLVADVHRVSVGGWRTSASGWNLRRLIEALTRVASAVGFAHDNQVLHRDIKPSNIMAGQHGEVLLMDWGIAKGLGVDSVLNDVQVPTSRRVHRTIDGLAIGTPPY
ncbi:MAG: serine/threonine protein kinase, partial [Kiritimatiellia bacterium]